MPVKLDGGETMTQTVLRATVKVLLGKVNIWITQSRKSDKRDKRDKRAWALLPGSCHRDGERLKWT